ncbi:MAG: peptide chain release factor N(5)-glutamine methyltransferase [Beijerinckiaceae bacterium]
MIDPRQHALSLQLQDIAGHGARTEAKWLIEAAGDDAALLERMVQRRLAGEPVDRILGHRGFWSLELIVTPDTLSPRADTETVVEAARDHTLKIHKQDSPLRILDLGTGTGAILLALLKEFPQATGLGIDISEKALDVARRNADLNQLSTRASFQTGSWLAGLAGTFDIIVSNPPYIPSADIAGLDSEVREHDPLLALDGGTDGLDAYRIILAETASRLSPQGIAVFEGGARQAADIAAIGNRRGLRTAEIHKDLAGIERAVVFGKM